MGFGDRDSQHHHHHHHPLHFVTGWLVAGHSLPAAVHTLRAALLFPSRVLDSTHPPAPFFSTKSIDPAERESTTATEEERGSQTAWCKTRAAVQLLARKSFRLGCSLCRLSGTDKKEKEKSRI